MMEARRSRRCGMALVTTVTIHVSMRASAGRSSSGTAGSAAVVTEAGRSGSAGTDMLE
ncbi:hypothetical protein PR202_ga10468 [Eleusine coracana subsp. coracana]|uniref:Uncharacterized protein n=1 Tax=Eleusine coracana subsp. coracana TaxID=191504 RepID=A0AAV5C6S5_ELECO|nr:hypothetical protein PR202_ga10468 [Eleusine coracana subsp. coracana]